MLEKCEGIPKGVQIIDMPNSILHSDLSKTVCKVLQHTGANQGVPRPQQKKLPYNSEISRTKDFQQVIRVRKDLKYLNRADLDFPEGIRPFINYSLCLYYRDFGTNVKNDGSMNKIKNSWWLHQKYYQSSFTWLFLKNIGAMVLPNNFQLFYCFPWNNRGDFTIQHDITLTWRISKHPLTL